MEWSAWLEGLIRAAAGATDELAQLRDELRATQRCLPALIAAHLERAPPPLAAQLAAHAHKHMRSLALATSAAAAAAAAPGVGWARGQSATLNAGGATEESVRVLAVESGDEGSEDGDDGGAGAEAEEGGGAATLRCRLVTARPLLFDHDAGESIVRVLGAKEELAARAAASAKAAAAAAAAALAPLLDDGTRSRLPLLHFVLRILLTII